MVHFAIDFITWIKFDWITIVGSISPSKCLVHKIFRVQLIFNTSIHQVRGENAWFVLLHRQPPSPLWAGGSAFQEWMILLQMTGLWSRCSSDFPAVTIVRPDIFVSDFISLAIEDQVPPRAGSGRKITLVFDRESEEKEDNRRAQFATHLPASFRPSRVIFGHFGASWGDFGTDLTHWF